MEKKAQREVERAEEGSRWEWNEKESNFKFALDSLLMPSISHLTILI